MTGTTPTYGLPYPQAGDPASSIPGHIQATAEAVESTLAGFGGIASPGSRQIPTLVTGGVPLGGQRAPNYRKVGNRVTHSGVIGFAAGIGTTGVGLYTVPAGFRPTAGEIFIVAASGGLVRIDVTAGGAVICQNTLAGGGFISLSGIAYDID